MGSHINAVKDGFAQVRTLERIDGLPSTASFSNRKVLRTSHYDTNFYLTIELRTSIADGLEISEKLFIMPAR